MNGFRGLRPRTPAGWSVGGPGAVQPRTGGRRGDAARCGRLGRPGGGTGGRSGPAPRLPPGPHGQADHPETNWTYGCSKKAALEPGAEVKFTFRVAL
ncbi:hypothetical protein AB0M28_26835, partial [Streptomyces sp. NPDC051940]